MKKLIIIGAVIIVISGCSHSEPRLYTQNEVENTIDVVKVIEAETVEIEKLKGELFLPILNFHHIGEAPRNSTLESRTWYVSIESFISYLDSIESEGFETIFLRELLQATEGELELPEKPIVITFDDAHIDVYENAWPILKERGFKFTINVMTGVRGEHYFNADIIKELDESGLVEFGSHTHYHEYLTRVDISDATIELEKSKEYLENLLDKEINIIAYPFGLYNDEIVKAAEDLGYRTGLTIDWGNVQDIEDAMRLKRYNITESSNLENILSFQGE